MRIVEALEGKGFRLPLMKGEAELAEKLAAITRQVVYNLILLNASYLFGMKQVTVLTRILDPAVKRTWSRTFSKGSKFAYYFSCSSTWPWWWLSLSSRINQYRWTKSCWHARGKLKFIESHFKLLKKLLKFEWTSFVAFVVYINDCLFIAGLAAANWGYI